MRIEPASINAVLKHIDQIAEGVAALSAAEVSKPPEPGKSAESGKPAPSEEPVRTFRTEVEEIDALLDGVSEVFASLNSLRDRFGAVERARHVAELLSAQLAPKTGERPRHRRPSRPGAGDGGRA